MSELLDAQIEVECEAMNPPRPVGFIIRQGRRVTAVLTYSQVEEAIALYDELLWIAQTKNPTRGGA